jgi:hypothetical protein
MNPQLQQKSTEKEEEYEVTNKAIWICEWPFWF